MPYDCIFITVGKKKISHPHRVIYAKCHGKDIKRPECIKNAVQTCLQEDKMATLHICRDYHVHCIWKTNVKGQLGSY